MTSKDAQYYADQINLFTPNVAVAQRGELRIIAGPLRRECTRDVNQAERIWRAASASVDTHAPL